jgi:hypothetical protein
MDDVRPSTEVGNPIGMKYNENIFFHRVRPAVASARVCINTMAEWSVLRYHIAASVCSNKSTPHHTPCCMDPGHPSSTSLGGVLDQASPPKHRIGIGDSGDPSTQHALTL